MQCVTECKKVKKYQIVKANRKMIGDDGECVRDPGQRDKTNTARQRTRGHVSHL